LGRRLKLGADVLMLLYNIQYALIGICSDGEAGGCAFDVEEHFQKRFFF